MNNSRGSFLFLLPLLFLLLFLLLLALLEQLLEVVHHLLVGQHSEFYQQQRVPLLHQGYELGSSSVVYSVPVHVDVDQGRVLPQDLLYLFYHRNLLRLSELIVADVQLTEGFVGLQSPKQLIDPFIAELVPDQGQVLDFAVMVGQDLLEVKGSFIVDSTPIEDQLLQSAVLGQSLCQVFEALRAELVIAEIELGGRDQVVGTESVSQVEAAHRSDLVDLQFQLFDCFCGFHVLAERAEAFIVGFEVGKDHYFEVLVAPLLAESVEDGLSALQTDLLPEHQLHQEEVTFLRWGVSPSRASSTFVRKSLDGVTPSSSHFLRQILISFSVESSSSWTFFLGPIEIKYIQTNKETPTNGQKGLSSTLNWITLQTQNGKMDWHAGLPLCWLYWAMGRAGERGGLVDGGDREGWLFKQVCVSIDFQFGSSPVSPFGVVADVAIGLVPEPVGKRPVLPLLLGEALLHEEGLVRSHLWIINITIKQSILFIYPPTHTPQPHSLPPPLFSFI